MECIWKVVFFIYIGITSVTSFTTVDENEFDTGYFLFNYIPCNVVVAVNRQSFQADCSSEMFTRVFSVIIVKNTLSVFENAKIRTITNGSVTYLSTEGLGFVEGDIVNETNSHVRGELTNLFRGELTLNTDLYTLQPAGEFFNFTNFNSILYKPGDLNRTRVCEVLPSLPKIPLSLQGICGTNESSDTPTGVDGNDTLTPRYGDREKDPPTIRIPAYFNRVCPLHIVVDHMFFRWIGANEHKKTMAFVADLINKVDDIFKATDLNFDDKVDNIGFVIKHLDIYVHADINNPSYPIGYFKGDDASAYLSLLSQFDFNDVCLGLGLTYEQFSGGTVGLAYVGHVEDNIAGGICDRRMFSRKSATSNNAAIVTLRSYGRTLTSTEAALVTAHELGHSYGATHDQIPCVPTAQQGGKYLMYSKMQSGSSPNNRKFSWCSRDTINKVLARKMLKYPICMVDRNDAISISGGSSTILMVLTLILYQL